MDIKTLVFFDIETTGLPSLDSATTKITELSFVACSKDHIQSLKENEPLPRLKHKLNLGFNPGKRISCESERITGLNNYLLECEKKFNKNTGLLINSFLEQLQTPICLISHNGEDFDYPILQKELKKLSQTLPENTFCIDSLIAFREIDQIKIQKQIEQLKEKDTELIELDDDILPLSENLHNDDDDEDGNKTNWQSLNETTPKRSITKNKESNRSKKRCTVNNQNENSDDENCVKVKETIKTPKARRGLFQTPTSITPPALKLTPKSQLKYLKGYKVTDLFKKYFNRFPVNSHCAEDDVIALAQCVVAERNTFIKYMEENAKLFSEIQPMSLKTLNPQLK